MLGKRLPLPFSITVHGVAYDTGEGEAVFRDRVKLCEAIEKLVNEHVVDHVSLDTDITTHSFVFRPKEQW